jgi:hypothetical protein
MMTKNKDDDNNYNKKKSWNLSEGNKYYPKVAQRNIL